MVPKARIQSVQAPNDSIEIPLVNGQKGVWGATFTLLTPGKYSATVGPDRLAFEVMAARGVPFFWETGLLSFSVLFILGGLFLWQAKKRTKFAR